MEAVAALAQEGPNTQDIVKQLDIQCKQHVATYQSLVDERVIHQGVYNQLSTKIQEIQNLTIQNNELNHNVTHLRQSTRSGRGGY